MDKRKRVLTRFFRFIWERELSFQILAERSGIERRRIARIAYGESAPREQEKEILARALQVEKSALFEPWNVAGEDDETYQLQQKLSEIILSNEGKVVIQRLKALLE